jgi:class 3 adenylate cyclase
MARYGISQSTLDALADYVRDAQEDELIKINPHYLAAALDIDSHQLLEIMAYAVQDGLFDLNWDVHCPHCQNRARTFFTLKHGQGQDYCPQCQVSFVTHLDHEIHVTFTVNPSIRKISEREPAIKPGFPPTYGLELLNVQPFRDLFADQVLPPGESLQVTRIVLLFTDLRGSTAMYAHEGDPKAFGWVREHFDVLFDAAIRNQGVTIKTIGDAVMCTFLSPMDALQASVDMHDGMLALNTRLELSGPAALSIRLGIHVGPCITVTLNDTLDYFGATVNIASRISHLSQGDDVILTPQMLQNDEIQAILPRIGTLKDFECNLHGYEQRFQLGRLIFHQVRLDPVPSIQNLS